MEQILNDRSCIYNKSDLCEDNLIEQVYEKKALKGI